VNELLSYHPAKVYAVVFANAVNVTGNDASEYAVGFEFVTDTPFNSYVIAYSATQRAYTVVLPAKVCDDDTAYDVPVPAAFVFQAANTYPVRARLPVLVANVTAAPFTVAADFAGADPDVALFAS
jgi:hypothetical protein